MANPQLKFKVKTKLIDIDLGWSTLVRRSKRLGRLRLHVGFPVEGQVRNGTRRGSGHKPYTSMSQIAQIAMWNELGTANIPARPFMRPAFDSNKAKLNQMKADLYKRVGRGTMQPETALKRLGVFMREEIKKSLRSVVYPPNAPATIIRKRGDKPLVDTRAMEHSTQYVIKKR